MVIIIQATTSGRFWTRWQRRELKLFCRVTNDWRPRKSSRSEESRLFNVRTASWRLLAIWQKLHACLTYQMILARRTIWLAMQLTRSSINWWRKTTMKSLEMLFHLVVDPPSELPIRATSTVSGTGGSKTLRNKISFTSMSNHFFIWDSRWHRHLVVHSPPTLITTAYSSVWIFCLMNSFGWMKMPSAACHSLPVLPLVSPHTSIWPAIGRPKDLPEMPRNFRVSICRNCTFRSRCQVSLWQMTSQWSPESPSPESSP